MKKKILVLLLTIGILIPQFASAHDIIPLPKKIITHKGTFTFSTLTTWSTSLTGEERERLAEFVPFAQKPARRNHISFRLVAPDKWHMTSDESYRIEITPQQVKVEAKTSTGLFYAWQTILQMKELRKANFRIPCGIVEDEPRFRYRGVMLDVSRHFFSADFLKKQIDLLAYYKINRLHLHLTDAGGWRLQIKQYPLLTQKAAWRTENDWTKWWGENDRRYVEEGTPGAIGGYYTQDEMRDLVAYASKKHITIIPEIEMPGHSDEVLAVYPQLSCSGEPYKHGDYCAGNEETFVFLENVLREVMDIFPSTYIHIGGDEASKQSWKTCSKCQKRMQEEGLKTVDELQSYFVRRMEKFLLANGRLLMGWDEILEGGLAPNATVMSWRGEHGGLEAVRQGREAVMTPGNFCYLDSYQDAPHAHPYAFGPYLPLKKVYSYNPVPEHLSPSEVRLIKGVQGCLWTEFVDNPRQVEYMLYPRLLALAEVAWSPQEQRNWDNFYPRVSKAVKQLEAKGYHPFPLHNAVGDRRESQSTLRHLAYGKTVTYDLGKYHTKYTAGGDGALTDGKRGNWTFTDGVWQGFIEGGKMRATVDLGSLQSIRRVSAHFMQSVTAEVFFPDIVLFEASEDGVHFVPLSAPMHAPEKSERTDFHRFQAEKPVEARYIRLTAHAHPKNGAWIFTDEIVVE